MSKTTHNLSTDARALITGWFAWGEKTSVTIGGEGAESVLSDRAEVAMKELIDNGYVIAKEFNRFGRMEYTGTAKCAGAKLSFKDMEKLGKFSATKPNPARKAAK